MLRFRPLPADTDLLALHRLAPSRYPLLLESVASGTAQGRWDLLLAAAGTGLALHPDGVVRDLDGTVQAGTFLEALDAQWRQARVPAGESRWPFRGGWALLLDYELAAQVEPILELPRRGA
ncbi:MAG TPA: aminodeoxychorismate synthase, component I, partial [Pseudoxanthomonas sp.]|nr:aminodeoxychorismate synthase, component I [Pseudoxanthomonas sp.]